MNDKNNENIRNNETEIDEKADFKKVKKKLTSKDQIVLLEIELAELKDKYIRAAAEFENFRKRNISEKSNWIKNANERIVLDLCDVIDNFERALHPEVEMNRESFEKGIKLIFQQLNNLLKKEGVEKLEALGKEFDPEFHDALAHIPSELEENTVIAIIQNGYKMNNKIIRPVRVAVSNGEKPEKICNESERKKK
ncbi:MAG: nucleotide exchange factor GrpE [Candidatus Cloacimonadales bacterium]|nr:nucleotide exchange factor GrpE [Candidatus Cloacimonadales bacterium]